MVKKPNGSELESMVYQDFHTVGGKEDDEEKGDTEVLHKQVYVYCDAMKADNQPTKWGKSQTYVKTRPTGMRNGIGEWVSVHSLFPLSPFSFRAPLRSAKMGREHICLSIAIHIRSGRSAPAAGLSWPAPRGRPPAARAAWTRS